MNQIRVQVIDNFLPDPEAYRTAALEQTFGAVEGLDGHKYEGVCVQPKEIFEKFLAEHLKRPVKVEHTFYRLALQAGSDDGVHVDNDYSPFAFVLFLNHKEHCRGGTAFWRHRFYGWTELPTEREIEGQNLDPQIVHTQLHQERSNIAAWERIHVAKMKFNRAILFPTQQFHSRWPFAGFGGVKESGRLAAVGFFRT